jgi:NADH-quinone oxidoreductase subunit B
MHDTEAAAQPIMITIGARAVRLHLVEAGLACCAVEQSAATTLLGGLASSSDGPDPEPGDPLQVLVVSGTVTDAMAPHLVAAFDAMPQPRAVLSFGACAATGGPYWDSYVVTNGIDQLLPVDVYVPGCPPTPAAFVEGLRTLVNAVDSVAQSPGGTP